jgi:hypothetical protein
MPKICPFSARSQTALCLALSGASSRSQPESAHTKARRALFLGVDRNRWLSRGDGRLAQFENDGFLAKEFRSASRSFVKQHIHRV